MTCDDAACRLDAIDAPGHQEILNQYVGAPGTDVLEQFLTARSDPGDLQIGERFQVRLEASRNDAMVVGDSDR